MESCAVPSSMDLDELIVKSTINRILSDNYTLLIICLVVLILLGVVLYYFTKQTYKVVIDYKQNNVRSGYKPAPESQSYTSNGENNDEPVEDPLKYQEPGKQKFYKSVDDIFKEYNVEKTNYIAATYGRENDDAVDSRIAYKKYDDYKYS